MGIRSWTRGEGTRGEKWLHGQSDEQISTEIRAGIGLCFF
eukprot:SAG25_NODE_11614_length_300_cov_0.761194_2_plen_39_part_01